MDVQMVKTWRVTSSWQRVIRLPLNPDVLYVDLWPFVPGSAIPVGIDVQVESVDSISEVNMVCATLWQVFLCAWKQCTGLCFVPFRTSPWLCTWGITGRTTDWPSPPAATRAEPSTRVSWRRSGCPTCSLSTPSALSSMTQPWRISCWGFFLTATSSTVSGKKTNNNNKQNQKKKITKMTKSTGLFLFQQYCLWAGFTHSWYPFQSLMLTIWRHRLPPVDCAQRIAVISNWTDHKISHAVERVFGFTLCLINYTPNGQIWSRDDFSRGWYDIFPVFASIHFRWRSD